MQNQVININKFCTYISEHVYGMIAVNGLIMMVAAQYSAVQRSHRPNLPPASIDALVGADHRSCTDCRSEYSVLEPVHECSHMEYARGSCQLIHKRACVKIENGQTVSREGQLSAAGQ